MAFDFDDLMTVEEAIADNGIKILTHGMSGAGKTVLCATAGEPTVILSTENGLLSLRKWARLNPEPFKRIKVLKIRHIDDLREAYKFLKHKKTKKLFKWVAVDSISEVAEQIINAEKKRNKDARKAYGTMADDILELLRLIRDLPYDVCMTAKQQYKEDFDEGKMMYLPMFPGQRIQQEIAYMFDEVFSLICETDDDDEDESVERWLQTENDGRHWCKDRSGILDPYEKPSLKHIKQKIENFRKEEEKPKKQGKKGKKK